MSSWTDSLNSVIGGIGSLANTAADVKEKWTGTSTSTVTDNTSLDNLASAIGASASSNKKMIMLIGGGVLALVAIFLFIKKR